MSIIVKDFEQLEVFDTSKTKILPLISRPSPESRNDKEKVKFKQMPLPSMIDFYFKKQNFIKDRELFGLAVIRVLNYKHPYKMAGLGTTRWKYFVRFVKANFTLRRDPEYTCEDEYSNYGRVNIKIKGNFLSPTEKKVDILPGVFTKEIKTFELVENKLHTLEVKKDFKNRNYRSQVRRYKKNFEKFNDDELSKFKACYNKFEKNRDDLYNLFLYLCTYTNVRKCLVPSNFDFNNMVYKNTNYPKKLHDQINFCKELKKLSHKKYSKKRMCHLVNDKILLRPDWRKYRSKGFDTSVTEFSTKMLFTCVIKKPTVNELVESKEKLLSKEQLEKLRLEKIERERVKNMTSRERRLEKRLKKKLEYERKFERNREIYEMSKNDFDAVDFLEEKVQADPQPEPKKPSVVEQVEEESKVETLKPLRKKLLEYLDKTIKEKMKSSVFRAYSEDWKVEGRSKDLKRFRKDYGKLVGEMGVGLGAPQELYDMEDYFFFKDKLADEEFLVENLRKLYLR